MMHPSPRVRAKAQQKLNKQRIDGPRLDDVNHFTHFQIDLNVCLQYNI